MYTDNNNNNDNRTVDRRLFGLLIGFFIGIIVLNIVLFSFFSAKLTRQFNQSINEINEIVDDQLPIIVADNLGDTLDDQVGEVAEELFTSIFLESYKREYNLPDNYAGIGVIAASQVWSVLELEVNAARNAPRDNIIESAQASAFIINEEGYAFTNAHCVTFKDDIWEPAGWPFNYSKIGEEIREYTTIKANFKDNSQKYDMEVVGYDVDKDLAIIKFKNPPQNLKPVIFGDSSLLNLGEEVAAIGNAQGLGTSLTTGVVSNTSQPYNNVNIIQTDTVINKGNSGGPLLNIYGEVVGVVSFKIVESAASEGLGFAITSNSVIEFIETVKTDKNLQINYAIAPTVGVDEE